MNLKTLHLRLVTGEERTYRGVLAHVATGGAGVLHVETVEFLDPLDVAGKSISLTGTPREHVISFPLTALLWWREIETPEAVPYINLPEVPHDAVAE